MYRRRKDGIIMKKENIRNIAIAVTVFILFIALFYTSYHLLRQRGVEGEKTIHIDVTVGSEIIKSINIHTNVEYLRQALEKENLIKGEEVAYGLWVTTVSGRVADSSKEEWWSLYKNGEFSITGIDDTPLEDGDSFEYKLMVGYNE